MNFIMAGYDNSCAHARGRYFEDFVVVHPLHLNELMNYMLLVSRMRFARVCERHIKILDQMLFIKCGQQ